MSLTKRLIYSASLVLLIFVGLITWGLERAFYDSALAARHERLLGQLYLLIASAEVDAMGHLSLANNLTEARFSLPGSGLYAHIIDQHGKQAWHSTSALAVSVPYQSKLAAAEKRFNSEQGFLVQSLGVSWAVGEQHFAFTFNVSEDKREFDQQIQQYRQSLWGWLLGLSCLLVAAQVFVLRWGLRPLLEVERELNAVESGGQEQLTGQYPQEIKRLTDKINAFVQHERSQQTRYRNALADLAHSLKTPLAVMRGALSGDAQQLNHTVAEQVARMDSIVMYQLQRAAASAKTISKPIAVLAIVQKITSALHKVHRDKTVSLQLDMTATQCIAMDEGDLMEVLGNLLDNAYKWCNQQVSVCMQVDKHFVSIAISDDGPGIPAAQAQHILQRGVRADELVPGHGIGLAVVRDIVEAYQGQVLVGQSSLGGAEIKLYFGR